MPLDCDKIDACAQRLDVLSKRFDNYVRMRQDATERDLKDDEPRVVIGTRGMKSKPFRLKFKNQAEMEKWLDSEEFDDCSIMYIQRAG